MLREITKEGYRIGAVMAPPPPKIIKNESQTQQIARSIRQQIEAGTLRDGEALPSGRELAKQWGVSVFTISEAANLLAAEGLIVNKSRSKRVVHAPDQSSRNEVRPRTPHVLLIGGYAGSGKSELGRILVRETGWPLLDKDTLTRPVVEAALELIGLSPNDRESQTYFAEIRPREYEAVIAAAVENVECGNSVLVTAPFIREFGDSAWVARAQASFTALGAQTSLVWVYCHPDTMHRYIRARGAARDTGKLTDWPGYLASIDINFRPPEPCNVIDNSASSPPLQGQAKDLLASILDRDTR